MKDIKTLIFESTTLQNVAKNLISNYNYLNLVLSLYTFVKILNFKRKREHSKQSECKKEWEV